MAKKEKVNEELEFKNVHEALGYIQRNLSCPKSQVGDKYKYRNCEDIMEALKPLLKKTNTILTFPDETILEIGVRFYVRTIAKLTHIPTKSDIGVYSQAREPESKIGRNGTEIMDRAQISGCSSSYARKYALNGLFAIDDTKDADFYDNTKSTPVKKTTDTPVKKTTDKPNNTWKPKGLPPTPLVESKIPEPNVEMMEQEKPPVFDFNKK